MDLGAATLVLHDLDLARADALAADVAKHYGAARCRLTDDLERDIAAADGIVNAAQTGMSGFPGNPVPAAAIKPTHWAADIIYTPAETDFLKAAAANGARTLNGRGMVVIRRPRRSAASPAKRPDPARLYGAFARGHGRARRGN